MNISWKLVRAIIVLNMVQDEAVEKLNHETQRLRESLQESNSANRHMRKQLKEWQEKDKSPSLEQLQLAQTNQALALKSEQEQRQVADGLQKRLAASLKTNQELRAKVADYDAIQNELAGTREEYQEVLKEHKELTARKDYLQERNNIFKQRLKDHNLSTDRREGTGIRERPPRPFDPTALMDYGVDQNYLTYPTTTMKM